MSRIKKSSGPSWFIRSKSKRPSRGKRSKVRSKRTSRRRRFRPRKFKSDIKRITYKYRDNIFKQRDYSKPLPIPIILRGGEIIGVHHIRPPKRVDPKIKILNIGDFVYGEVNSRYAVGIDDCTSVVLTLGRKSDTYYISVSIWEDVSVREFSYLHVFVCNGDEVLDKIRYIHSKLKVHVLFIEHTIMGIEEFTPTPHLYELTQELGIKQRFSNIEKPIGIVMCGDTSFQYLNLQTREYERGKVYLDVNVDKRISCGIRVDCGSAVYFPFSISQFVYGWQSDILIYYSELLTLLRTEDIPIIINGTNEDKMRMVRDKLDDLFTAVPYYNVNKVPWRIRVDKI